MCRDRCSRNAEDRVRLIVVFSSMNSGDLAVLVHSFITVFRFSPDLLVFLSLNYEIPYVAINFLYY